MFRMDPIELIENLRNEVKRGKRECQNESLALFKKIFTSIETNTDTPSVNIGLDNLINEVNDLKTKLIEVTRERDNLLNTVDNLKIAMQQLSAKMMTTMQPLPIANDSKTAMVRLMMLRVNHNQFDPTTGKEITFITL